MQTEISLTGITHAYRTQGDPLPVLDRLDLDCATGSFTAVVGPSGCGKSTLFQLMMRFYDSDSGNIYLDGINLKNLDLNWLRAQIGYVKQEPILFATTIKENLFMSKQSTDE